MKIKERLHRAVNKSNHNGKIRTLKKRIDFIDNTFWPEGLKVRILGVNMLFARIQAFGTYKFQTALTTHASIKWQ